MPAALVLIAFQTLKKPWHLHVQRFTQGCVMMAGGMYTHEGAGVRQGVCAPAVAQSSGDEPERLDLLGMHGEAVTC